MTDIEIGIIPIGSTQDETGGQPMKSFVRHLTKQKLGGQPNKSFVRQSKLAALLMCIQQ